MYRKILVPLDGSDLAESALPMAVMLAAAQGSELHLVHAVSPLPDYSHKTPKDDMDWEERASATAATYLEAVAQKLEGWEGEYPITSATVQGRASEALAEYCERQGIDLLVMTTHGEGGLRRVWLGSVADELLRKSAVPMLFLRPEDGEAESPLSVQVREVLLALDGSPEAEVAADHALEIAETFDAAINLVQVKSPGLGISGLRADPAAAERSGLTEDAKEEAMQYLSSVAAEIRGRGNGSLKMTMHVVGAEHPADGILEQEGDADLVVMATHGRSGFDRMVVGSVTDKVLRAGVEPLLVVRTTEATG